MQPSSFLGTYIPVDVMWCAIEEPIALSSLSLGRRLTIAPEARPTEQQQGTHVI